MTTTPIPNEFQLGQFGASAAVNTAGCCALVFVAAVVVVLEPCPTVQQMVAESDFPGSRPQLVFSVDITPIRLNPVAPGRYYPPRGRDNPDAERDSSGCVQSMASSRA